MPLLSELFAEGVPIIQAPMAGVQGSALAVAVCGGGGLGSLPCAMLSQEQMAAEMAAMQQATARPFNVNFFCHKPVAADEAREAAWRRALDPYYREFGVDPGGIRPGPGRRAFGAEDIPLLVRFRPAVVSFHFGLPEPELLAHVKATGAMVWASATTVDEAKWLQARGVDAVIAQGSEAGGHRGTFLSGDVSTQAGTFALLPQIVSAVGVPVIAAGGIADAAGVRAALGLGASAAQVGTAYLLCPEATTGALHRAALQSDAARETALTRLFSGRPARGIVNRLMRELGAMNPVAPAFPHASDALAPLRAKAEAAGDGGFSPLWCGQNATGCAQIPAGQLTRRLAGL